MPGKHSAKTQSTYLGQTCAALRHPRRGEDDGERQSRNTPVRADLVWQTLLMRRTFNLAQRLVVVFGLGAAVYLIGVWATSLHSNYGWVGYAPLARGSVMYSSATSVTFVASSLGGGFHPWFRLAIWLVLIAVWTGVSVALLRSPRRETTSDGPSS